MTTPLATAIATARRFLTRVRRVLIRSRRTGYRLLRTALQTVAGGGTGVLLARILFPNVSEPVAGAIGLLVATWAQNTLEDLRPGRDQRPKEGQE